jgi:anaerobic magnesium-protoporphyrin IX monomethyl ester cyclase
LDTFGFNRLCAYRGTPLWQEYVARGIIDDQRDWHKWFKCSDIDPTTVPSALVNRLRAKGYGRLFLHRIVKRPIRTLQLLRAFGRHMKTSDIIKLLASPFRRRTLTRKAELPARMLDAGLEEPLRQAAAATNLLARQIGNEIAGLGNAPLRSGQDSSAT